MVLKYTLRSQPNSSLYRVVASRDIDGIVRAGEWGGLVESEDNLSQEGKAWISKEAKVIQHAFVTGDAQIKDHATVTEYVKVSDSTEVGGHCMLAGSIEIKGTTTIAGNVFLKGRSLSLSRAAIKHFDDVLLVEPFGNMPMPMAVYRTHQGAWYCEQQGVVNGYLHEMARIDPITYAPIRLLIQQIERGH